MSVQPHQPGASPSAAAPESIARNYLPEWVTLGIYVALVAAVVPHHEPVADEAQAWQLVRSIPLTNLFHTYLRYEGSPGLWYVVLSILTHLRVSYTGLRWFCAAVAAAATALLIFRAPFPRLIRILLPFTYFLAFQYAIVARSYVLFPPLIFAMAAYWEKSLKRPWTMALLLGLVANVSLHCAVISGGFAIAYAIEWMKYRTPEAERTSRQRQWISAVVVLLLFYGFVVWTALPPRDLWVASQIPPGASVQAAAPHSIQSESKLPIRTSALRSNPHDIVIGALAASALGIATPALIGIPFWIVMIWHFARRRQLHLMLPLAFFVLFSAVSAFAFWHAGLLAVSLIAAFWISLDRQTPVAGPPAFSWVVSLSLLYAIVVQIAWTVDAMHFDYKYAYSPDLAASKFLRPYVEKNARMAVTYSRQTGISAYDAVGLLPYFNHNVFANLAQPFWIWSTGNTTEAAFWRELSPKPDLIVVEYNERTPYDPAHDTNNGRIATLAAAGYSHTQTFCGAKLAQFTVLEYTCHLVYQRNPN